ncbi:hypothetical protein V6N12_023348 [Hibiscus sabdariffa]|uniref:RNase H type-1 domain-containing protein n=1 Tax=Hibiscus sabdariffa TaxID=183260 RepID=A0ABR2FXT1_9ROSI
MLADMFSRCFFGVFGVAKSNGAGCGGALRFEGGHIRALFSGPVLNYGADFVTLFAVKVALEVLLEAKWSEDVVLVMELESQVVLNWLSSPLTRPRKWWDYFEELDKLMSRSNNIHFKLVPKGVNSMAVSLATLDIQRNEVLKAWW